MIFPQPERQNYPISQFVDRLRKKEFVLAEGQRNPDTWHKDYYRALIESIMSNTLTSPFICNRRIQTYHIIDGGHRTCAIEKFMNDEFEIMCPSTNRLVRYSNMTDEEKADFENKGLFFTVYSNLNNSQIEKLFFNINNQLPLSPGEQINGYISIPICVLARKLGEKYSHLLKAHINRCIDKENTRADSSILMFMILCNFQERCIINGEKITECKKEKLKSLCEKYRNVEIDEKALEYMVSRLFDIISARNTTERYVLNTIATIQWIMIKNGYGMDERRWSSINYVHAISQFFVDVDTPGHILKQEFDSLKRNQGVSNPGFPQYCMKRGDLFNKYLMYSDST